MTPPRTRSIRKWLAGLLLGLALLAGLGAWYMQGAQIRGVGEELSERGESIAIRDFIPPAIPDEENFFGDPLWLELTNPALKASAPGAAEKETRLLDRMVPELTAEEIAALQSAWPLVPWPAEDFQNKRPALLNRVWTKFPKTASPEERRQWAGFTLAVLQPVAPLFAKLRELGRRPQARFPVEYERGMSLIVPHIPYLLMQAQLLSSRAKAEIYQQNGGAALEDIELMLRLADALKTEPSLISFLARAAILRIALAVFHVGLESHVWSNDQLLAFEKRLHGLSSLADFPLAVRGDRALLNQTMGKTFAAMHRPRAAPSPAPLFDLGDTVRRNVVAPMLSMANMRDLAAYNRQTQIWVDALETKKPGEWPTQMKSPVELAKIQDPDFWKAYRPVLGSYRSVLDSEAVAIELEARILQARLASALERYWLRQGDYPATLQALVPEFLPDIPVDLTDPQPMKYRLLDPQKYLLYSIGFNRVDEGGTVKTKREEGDWVWGQWKP